MAVLKRFLPLILVAAVFVLILATGWADRLSFDAVREQGDALQAMVEARPVASLIVLMVVFTLLTASDPDRGLDLLRRRRPDLILLDLHLPDRADGARMLRAIRADADPVLRATPVVMVTADLTAGTERELLAAGASGFVGKPVDVPALLAAVDEHLGRH